MIYYQDLSSTLVSSFFFFDDVKYFFGSDVNILLDSVIYI